eukprot:TRINITY_DN8104_c1_g1_i1.p2 TRINITY_DN8104_c1_g1~~TRINITY_DN8104_c1_g1_i1.p2  ORF type:complete len:240 (+),score=-11.98 TRINITY_DN8104_c1_g1_i1:44-721(+)
MCIFEVVHCYKLIQNLFKNFSLFDPGELCFLLRIIGQGGVIFLFLLSSPKVGTKVVFVGSERLGYFKVDIHLIWYINAGIFQITVLQGNRNGESQLICIIRGEELLRLHSQHELPSSIHITMFYFDKLYNWKLLLYYSNRNFNKVQIFNWQQSSLCQHFQILCMFGISCYELCLRFQEVFKNILFVSRDLWFLIFTLPRNRFISHVIVGCKYVHAASYHNCHIQQ